MRSGVLLSSLRPRRSRAATIRYWVLWRGPRIGMGATAGALLPLVLIGQEIPLLIAGIIAAVCVAILAVQHAIMGIQKWILNRMDDMMDDLDKGMSSLPPPDLTPRYPPGQPPVSMTTLGAMADRGAESFLKSLPADVRQEVARMLLEPDSRGPGTP